MIVRSSALLLMAMLLPSIGKSAETAGPPDYRVLVLATPSLDHPDYRAQAAQLVAAWAGLVERDFTVRTETGSPSFQVRLIGKDGGVKLSAATPVTSRALFDLVDAMPMRQAEIRERQPTPKR